MRKLVLFILLHSFVYSQTAFHNYGNVQMHTDAEIGFHTHLVNDGTFNDNLGFTGFYSDTETLTVSGNNRAIFNNVEIGVINNLELYTAMGVRKELLFLDGKVITPREDLTVSLDFINYDLYAGEDDFRHVDGYTSNTGSNEFIFPIGDDDRLRPMITPAQEPNTYLHGAYFYEDPNTANTFATSFATNQKHFEIDVVSNYEFWDLNGTTATSVTLTWDNLSNISLISPVLNDLIVVGWNIVNERWENLGNTKMTGDINAGSITSIPFTPNQYDIITFGSLGEISNNYYISPNGDEYDEFLVFEELEEYPLSKLIIFNRWGNLVFERENYENDFSGISEGRATLKRKKELPVGTYFYELNYGSNDLSLSKKGWVYIHR